MNPILKKALAALAITKGIEKIQEMRKPKRSVSSRLFPLVAIVGLGAGAFYLNKIGKLQPMVAKAKDMASNNSNGAVLDDSLRQPASSTTV